MKTHKKNNKARDNTILGIDIPTATKQQTLEKIQKHLAKRDGNCFVISLNPEILVISEENKKFKEVVKWAQIKIVDGSGVALAGRILGVQVGNRYTGVDLTEDLINMAVDGSLTVMLIGGKGKLAERLGDCYRSKYSNLKIYATDGIEDIKNPKIEEESEIFTIVADREPHIVLTSFGSPAQELWMYKHRKKFDGVVCAGVGGAFEYLSGDFARPPKFVRDLGIEYLYRLVRQPWRWRRQLRLFRFGLLVFKEKFI